MQLAGIELSRFGDISFNNISNVNDLAEAFKGVTAAVDESVAAQIAAADPVFSVIRGQRRLDELAAELVDPEKTRENFEILQETFDVATRLMTEAQELLDASLEGDSSFNTFSQAFTDVLSLVLKEVPGFNEIIADAITEAGGDFERMADFVIEMGNQMGINLEALRPLFTDTLPDILDNLPRNVRGVIDITSEEFNRLPPEMQNAVVNMADEARRLRLEPIMRQAAVDARTGFETEIYHWMGAAGTALEGAAWNSLHSTGDRMIDGLLWKIRQRQQDLYDVGRGAVYHIRGGVTHEAQIRSPSKLFAKYGGNMIDGLMIGMEDRFGALTKTAQSIVGHMPPPSGVPSRSPTAATSSTPSSSSSLTVNMYTSDPVKAGRQSIRELRNLAYLNSPFDTPQTGGGLG
jgi:hypothetical protein